jgi:hypothetical protein
MLGAPCQLQGFLILVTLTDVLYAMPLKKSTRSFKRLSSESASDTGYETLDSVVDEQSQMHSSGVSQYEDEMIDEDENESPDEWLESMGVAAEEIRRIRSKQVMKQSGVPKKYIF